MMSPTKKGACKTLQGSKGLGQQVRILLSPLYFRALKLPPVEVLCNG